MSRPRALDLFCGAGGVSVGLELAGFDVTGVDIRPQPHHRGGRFVQADALIFPLEGYDFIWASPPCQAHTVLRKLNGPGSMFGLQTPDGRAEIRRHRLFESNMLFDPPQCRHGRADLITVTGHTPQNWGLVRRRRGVLSVVGGGSPVLGKRTLCVAGGKAMSGGMKEPQPGWHRRRALSVVGNQSEISRSGWHRRSTQQTNVVCNQVRETFSVDDARAAMGIDWMPMKYLSQAIPPAYAEWIGRKVLGYLSGEPQPARQGLLWSLLP